MRVTSTNSLRDVPPFPAACPKCLKVAGMPFMAGTSCEDDRINVGMRCDACAYEWNFVMPTVRPKPDRRGNHFQRRAS